MDESLPPSARSVGQKAPELSGLSAFFLWLDRFSRRRVIRIGSNWESLIASVPAAENFYLITEDKDYVSLIDTNCLSVFLSEEWKEKKNSDIFFYKSLSAFFKQHFPDIKLATQLEREFAISNLINSGTFANTHVAIAKLLEYTDLSDSEINQIIESSISNGQIYQIRRDVDVSDYLTTLVGGKENIIEPNILIKFNEMYNPQLKVVDVSF